MSDDNHPREADRHPSFEDLAFDDPVARQRWSELHGVSPLANLYNSWSWMELWSRVYAMPLRCVVVSNGPRPIGAFTLVRQRVWRGPFPVRVSCLGPCSASGDDIWLEYNQFLAAAGQAADVGRAIASYARSDAWWQEWRLVGAEATVASAVLDHLPAAVRTQQTPSYFVRLDAAEDPLELCSRNTRSQVRRSDRLLEETGARFEVARTVEAAREFLEQLAPLHQRDWQERGFAGSFSRERFVEFHRRAIDRFFGEGAIYLARIRQQQETLGVIYGFLTGGRFDFYQSGLSRTEDNRVKLGYSLHHHAMLDLKRRGVTEYDFLAGTERYKSCWGGVARAMVWARVQRPLLRFRIESGVRSVARLAKGRRR